MVKRRARGFETFGTEGECHGTNITHSGFVLLCAVTWAMLGASVQK